MNFFTLAAKNIFNLPLISFFLGGLVSLVKPGLRLPKRIGKLLTIYILFCIGLKGGGPLVENFSSSASLFLILLGSLILWGLLSPLFSFSLLKRSTKIDPMTIAAIAASFGSVSVMTFVTAISFLEQINVPYHKMIIAALAIMEIPAIISGLFLAKRYKTNKENDSLQGGKVFRESFINTPILSIVLGLASGALFYTTELQFLTDPILLWFKPLLCLFLFDMGLSVGMQRDHFRSFSLSLNLFGLYMPLIGGLFGVFLSWSLNLDVGTATLLAVLAASASYIAVPAAMKIALPEAKEAIYLPLSLGIAFPFNVIIGIPAYYYLSTLLMYPT